MFNNNPMIDHSTIQRILDATDIVDVVKEFVTLRKAGSITKDYALFITSELPRSLYRLPSSFANVSPAVKAAMR